MSDKKKEESLHPGQKIFDNIWLLFLLSLVAKGASERDVAEKLTVSLNTVKTHIRNILSKLRVTSRREAAKLAQSKGML